MVDREQFWQSHVDACGTNRETQKAYRERRGIAPKTFRKWRSCRKWESWLAGATRAS